MTTIYTEAQRTRDIEASALADRVEFHFEATRREFVQVLGAGIVIALCATALAEGPAGGGGRGRGGGGGGINGQAPANLAARLHIGKDGMITVLCGKVECGQGLRAEVTQAAAEELRVAVERIVVILADSELTPNDGATVGSGTTPRTIPPIRQAAAAARELLANIAVAQWKVGAGEVEVREGKVVHAASGRAMSFAEIAGSQDLEQALKQSAGNRNVSVTAVAQWKVMGTPVLRPNAKDIVMGRHTYPSDVQIPGMLYGKVLRAPGFNTVATEVDVSDAKGMKGVTVVRDGDFVGVAAASGFAAKKAIEAIALSTKWQSKPHPSSRDLADYLVKNARAIPANRFVAAAGEKMVKASYFIPYVQHAPMEPRAAVAQWSADGGKLTVWTGSQNPGAVQMELANAFRIAAGNIRVIINDFGGGFGGKHTGECAVEAARLAKGAGQAVSLRWTREEEFTWAYFRPAGVMQAEATLDASGKIASWYFININSGPSAVQTPYAIQNNLCQTVTSNPPLRHGSYRGLAATANVFARESFMDELSEAAGRDPLEFRLAHLQDTRLRDVLETVATRFDWAGRSKKKDVSVGIACATEKGSYVASAAEIVLDKTDNSYRVSHVAEVFECGAIVNPAYLMSQVQGAIMQGLGPVLREEIVFEEGVMRNASFADYLVPRFADVPSLDVHLLNRPDLASAGAGETPIVTLAPAIANAVSRAAGKRVREMPVRVTA